MLELARSLAELGRFPVAAALLRRYRDEAAAARGDTSAAVALCTGELATVEGLTGANADAVADFHRAAALAEALWGRDDPRTAALYDEALRTMARRRAFLPPETADWRCRLALYDLDPAHPDSASRVMAAGLADAARAYGRRSPRYALLRRLEAQLLVRHDRAAAATGSSWPWSGAGGARPSWRPAGGRRHSRRWTRPSGGPVRYVALGAASRVDSLVVAWRSAVLAVSPGRRPTARQEAECRRLGRDLHRLVWAPLFREDERGRRAAPRRVWVVPDGSLWRVDLAALPDSTGTVVLERRDVRWLAGERFLLASAGPDTTGHGLLAVAAPMAPG